MIKPSNSPLCVVVICDFVQIQSVIHPLAAAVQIGFWQNTRKWKTR